MSAQSEQPESLDQILAQFLVELEHAPDGVQTLRNYEANFSQYAAQFRDVFEMRKLLGRETAAADQSPPVRLGDFHIVREISRGGMKVIYEAIQDPLDRRVAVATIRDGRVLPQYRERFLREQRVLARLHQTNTASIPAGPPASAVRRIDMCHRSTRPRLLIWHTPPSHRGVASHIQSRPLGVDWPAS